MVRNFRVILIGSLFIFGTFFFTTNSHAKTNDGTIKIGMISPLTGAAADYGKFEKGGSTLAAEQINAKGGILGKRIQLIFEDDTSTPEGGVNGVRHLLDQENVVAVVGSSNSSIAIAEKEVTRGRVLHMVTAAQSDVITKEGHKWLLDGNPTVTDYTAGLIKMVLGKFKPKRIAIFAENTEYGQDNVNLMKQLAHDKGSQVVATIWYTQQDADFTSNLTQIKAAHPDMIYVINAAPQQMPSIYKQMSELGMNNIMKVNSPGTVTMQAIATAGGAMNGVYTADLWTPDVKNKISKSFTAAYTKRFGYKPEKVAALAYMDINIIAKAMQEAQSTTDYDKIVKIIKSQKWPSMFGVMQFDKNGRNHSAPILLRVVGKQLKIVE